MDMYTTADHQMVVDEVCRMPWDELDAGDMTSVAWAYYYFSIQFRESLESACQLHPDDLKLTQLHHEECNTANLSPWPGVAAAGERINHDEFMRRTLTLSPISEAERARIEPLGGAYLAITRAMSPSVRALSIASYEDGGLEAVFKAMLRSPSWDGSLLEAFRHFLVEHIRFDSDPDQGHGSLSRHLVPDESVTPAWRAFRDILVGAAPRLAA